MSYVLSLKFIVRGRSLMTSLPSALHLLMFPLLSAALLLSPSLCLHVCCLFCLQVNFNLCLLLESSLDVRVGGFFLQAALAKCTCSTGFTSLSLIGLNNLSRTLSLALMLWRTTLLPSITLWQYVTFFPCDFFFSFSNPCPLSSGSWVSWHISLAWVCHHFCASIWWWI